MTDGAGATPTYACRMKRFAFTLVVAALAAAFGPHTAGAKSRQGAAIAQVAAQGSDRAKP
jgi:hypothetical protein